MEIEQRKMEVHCQWKISFKAFSSFWGLLKILGEKLYVRILVTATGFDDNSGLEKQVCIFSFHLKNF